MQALIFKAKQPMTLILALLACIACMLGFQYLSHQLGADMLDIMNGYDRATVDSQMLAYGEAGRQLYGRAALSLDMVYPLAYGTLLVGLMGRATSQTRFTNLALLPVALVVLDILENLQIFALLVQYPALTDWQVQAASLTTQGKWLVARVTVLMLLLLAMLQLFRAVFVRLNR